MSRIARALEKAHTEHADAESGPRHDVNEEPRPGHREAPSPFDFAQGASSEVVERRRADVPWDLGNRVHARNLRGAPGRGRNRRPPLRAVGRLTDGRAATGTDLTMAREPRGLAPWSGGPPSSAGPYDGPPLPPEPPSLGRYWTAARRRWRTGLLIFLVVVSGMTAGLLLRRPLYTATGLLEIKPETTGSAAPVQTLFDASKMQADDLETQFGILRSDTIAERVLKQAERTGVHVLPPPSMLTRLTARLSPGPRTAASFPTPDDMKKFRDLLLVDPQKGSRLVAVSFTALDSRVSAMTANSVLDNYLQLRMEDAQRSQKWLERQLQAAQQRLEASERQLQDYIREHGIRVVETGKGEAAVAANERLQTLHDLLVRAQADRMAKQSQAEQDRRLSAARDVDSPVVQNLVMRLAELRRQHAQLSSTFKEEYPAVKALTSQIKELEQQLSQESRFVVSRGERDFQAAARQETLLRSALDEQNRIVQALNDQSAGHAGYGSLKDQMVANENEFTALDQKVKELAMSAALRASSAAIVDRAKAPVKPDGLPLPLTLALTAVVGLVLAAAGMFAREYFDTSMRTVADVERLGVPALGAIPAVGADLCPATWRAALLRRAEWRRIDDRDEPQTPLAEAFAALRSAVLVRDDAPSSSRVLLVTSAQSEEGKTTIALNLALSLARLNYSVLLVDANLRFPCVAQALRLPEGPGLVDHLVSGEDWRGLLHRDVRPNLDVLAGARPQTSPADLLSLPPLARLLDEAASEYDFVVLDSPALLPHPADVHSLAAVADSVLFAVRQGTTAREAVLAALAQLDRVSGIVLNRFSSPEVGVHWQGARQAARDHA